MDITPLINTKAQVIQGYNTEGIKVSGETYSQTILVFPDHVEPINVERFEALNEEHFSTLKDLDVLIIGTGAKQAFLPKDLKGYLTNQQIVSETMTTASACRTYNVLLSEGRRFACLLFLPKE